MAVDRFPSGIASGDPTTTSLVLWTRLAGLSAPVTWFVEDDHGVVQATGTVDPDPYGVARVEVDGLRPGSSYRYWFAAGEGAVVAEDGGSRSSIGRTRTLAADPSSVRLGIACCARRPSGDFSGYRTLAERDVDLVVHLGDYIYEDGGAGERGPHEPAHECVTGDDYDRRYAQYRTDEDLQALHAAAPWVATLDDHEIDDNVARFRSHRLRSEGGGAGSGVDPARRRAGVEAHARWMPQRPHGNGPTPRDRHVQIGELCDIVLVDTRLGGREAQVGDGGPTAAPDAAQSPRLLTEDQWDWLDGIIGGSSAAWLVLVSQVQVAPLRLGWWPSRSTSTRWPWRLAPIVNPDQWDGYPGERRRLIDLLDRHDRDDVVILSGDLHARFVTCLDRPGREPVTEVTTPSISAPTFGSMLDRRLPIPSRWTGGWIRAINPHIQHLDLHHHGVTVVDVDADTIRLGDGTGADGWQLTLHRRAARSQRG